MRCTKSGIEVMWPSRCFCLVYRRYYTRWNDPKYVGPISRDATIQILSSTATVISVAVRLAITSVPDSIDVWAEEIPAPNSATSSTEKLRNSNCRRVIPAMLQGIARQISLPQTATETQDVGG